MIKWSDCLKALWCFRLPSLEGEGGGSTLKYPGDSLSAEGVAEKFELALRNSAGSLTAEGLMRIFNQFERECLLRSELLGDLMLWCWWASLDRCAYFGARATEDWMLNGCVFEILVRARLTSGASSNFQIGPQVSCSRAHFATEWSTASLRCREEFAWCDVDECLIEVCVLWSNKGWLLLNCVVVFISLLGGNRGEEKFKYWSARLVSGPLSDFQRAFEYLVQQHRLTSSPPCWFY